MYMKISNAENALCFIISVNITTLSSSVEWNTFRKNLEAHL
jgi:hypothetical protein